MSSLFRRCRDALGLSAQGVADALHVAEGRTVRRWEAGDSPVPGPVWVALRYMLRDAGHAELAGEVDMALADADDVPLPRSGGASSKP